MHAKSSLPPQSLSAQSGIALITVLLFLILIMIIGAVAVRQASVDLNVAASDQVGTLLLNTSDSVLAHIEVVATDKDKVNTQEYQRMMSQRFGILGHFAASDSSKIGNQVSSCYSPKNPEVFDIENAYVRKLDNNFISERFSCDANNTRDYASDRHTAMTQIIVRGMRDYFSDNFDQATRGMSDTGITDTVAMRTQINSISVLPAMSDKSASDIKKCLGHPVGNASDYKVDMNVNDCLRGNNIPSTFVVEEGVLVVLEDGGYNGTELANNCEQDEKCRAALAK